MMSLTSYPRFHPVDTRSERSHLPSGVTRRVPAKRIRDHVREYQVPPPGWYDAGSYPLNWGC